MCARLDSKMKVTHHVVNNKVEKILTRPHQDLTTVSHFQAEISNWWLVGFSDFEVGKIKSSRTVWEYQK